MDRFPQQRQRLHSLFGVFFAPEVTMALLDLARPALALGPEGEVTVRLGGAPLLPAGEPWPVWEGRPLEFLGSADFAKLAAVTPLPGLPQEGTAAFYSAGGAQEEGAWRVFTGELGEAPAPEGTVPFPLCALGASPFLSVPSPQEPVLERLDAEYSGFLEIYEQLYAAWSQHAWPDDAPVHQLGGWPVLAESPVGPQATEEEWRLLLQLDSDERLGWSGGDPGRVYFCTRGDESVEHARLTAQAVTAGG